MTMRLTVNKHERTCITLILTAILSLAGGDASADSVPSRVVEKSAPSKAAPRLLGGVNSASAIAAVLPAITANDVAVLRAKNARSKLFEVGIGRTLPAQFATIDLGSIAWISASDGTRYATLEFKSTDAAALRLAIDRRSFPKGASITVYGTAMPALIYGPFGAAESRSAEIESSNVFWLPVVEGDTARIELQVGAGVPVNDRTLNIASISHLLSSIRFPNQKNLSDLGDSGACNIDIACRASWVTTGQSVAKYYVTGPNGGTGICTGTLVNSNTTTTPIPAHFLTARHCVATQSAASAMQFYWFFQRAMCSGANPTSVTEQLGGATFITAVAANDISLVRINSTPPAGAIYAAWNSTPVSTLASVVALHHPAGDVKKYSEGTVQGFTEYSSNTASSTGSHIRVAWNQGTTEGGSSGSGLFNSAQQLVGTLHGGGASCATPTQPDWYGRFDQAYPSLQAWLASGTNPPPVPPPPPPPPAVVDLSSGVAVSDTVGVGSSIWYRIQSTTAHSALTVTLSNLSDDADLRVYRDSQAGALGCESELFGTAVDSCSIASPGNTTWYIEVFGYAAADFTVTATLSTPAPATGRSSGGGDFELILVALLSAIFALRLTLPYSTQMRNSRRRLQEGLRNV